MTLKTKIWLLLSALMGVVFAVDVTVSYRRVSTELRAETEYDAQAVYGFLMAMRRVYQQQFIDSGIEVTGATIGFLPAHSVSRISRDFANWNNSGIVFNNVSDRPRNPANQADAHELEAMAWFRANPHAREKTRDIVDDKGIAYLLFTAPIWIEPACLRCHGSAEAAPASISANYSAAFDYQVGDLRGVVSIKMPTAQLESRRNALWGWQSAKSLAGYVTLLLALGFLLDRLVTRRLAKLQTGAQRVADGDYDARMSPQGDDELAGLARTFNHMAQEVQAREQTLRMLSQAIEQSPESVVLTGLDGRIEYVNEHFIRNTGYAREEVIGQDSSLLRSDKTPSGTYADLWAALAEGRVWQGEFTNQRKDGSEFVEAAIIAPVRTAEGRIVQYLAIKQDITDKKRADAEINRLAYSDALTGLSNRVLLIDHLNMVLAMARRQVRFDALLLFNVDRFKNLNEARGHELGDALLVAVGGRLASQLREGDTLARMAGDEFAILLQDLGTNAEAATRRALEAAEKLHAELRLPFRFGVDDEVSLTASIGIALCPKDEDDTAQEILRRADTALHRAKDAGGAETAFFETAMGESAEQRFRIERELRRAIPAGELRLYVQAQVDAHGRLAGAEALVRWQHPQRGLLPPGAFINVAEESGLIVDLGTWVLAEACRLMAREAAAGHPFKLSVNMSPRHFRQPGVVPWIKDLLAASGADPTLLTLEVTEGLVIDNIDDVVAKMSALCALGIRFSVDDFGTGYSSLSYLKRLPIHELKIDKSFVQDAPTDADDAALVGTILAVAANMRLEVVAEGVETAQQAAFFDCHAGVIRQGYLYGRPEPAEEWLERWRS